MNERIRELADKIWEEKYWTNPNKDKLLPAQLNRFAELIIRECTDRCGSQADQRNILRSFGLEVESNIKYTASERNGSVNSQYEREYNLPKG